MKRFKNILLFLLAVLPMLYTAVAVCFILPDTVAAHFGVNGTADRYGSKYEALILPAFIIVIWIVYFLIRKIIKNSSTDDNEKVQRNLGVLDSFILGLFFAFNVLNIFVLYIMESPEVMLQQNSLIFIILGVVLGILFILLGNILPKTKRNSFIGLRTKLSMESERNWYICNRASGIAMVISGFAIVIGALITRSMITIFIMVISLIISQVLAILYSYAKIKKK